MICVVIILSLIHIPVSGLLGRPDDEDAVDGKRK